MAAPARAKKCIIDTDPGIDDAMAILLAFQSPELQVVGITTTFGNVRTPTATSNALLLCELAGRTEIPIVQGETTSIKGVAKERIADFVHGSDGMGNTYPQPPIGKALDGRAADFLNARVSEAPGEITIIALGPLTNLAKAIELDPMFPKKVGQIVILGGAFFVNGNVNPAAEANIYGDTDAADMVLSCGADILVIGVNITHQVILTDEDLLHLRDAPGRYGKFLHGIAQFYAAYHHNAYDIRGVYLHDPTTVLAAVEPSLFTYITGVVRVQIDGLSKGMTIVNARPKKWASMTEWCVRPAVKVAMTVDALRVVQMVKERLMAAT